MWSVPSQRATAPPDWANTSGMVSLLVYGARFLDLVEVGVLAIFHTMQEILPVLSASRRVYEHNESSRRVPSCSTSRLIVRRYILWHSAWMTCVSFSRVTSLIVVSHSPLLRCPGKVQERLARIAFQACSHAFEHAVSTGTHTARAARRAPRGRPSPRR